MIQSGFYPFSIYREQTITFNKKFYNKAKTVTYSAEVWRKAEKYFSTVEQAKCEQADVKLNIYGDVYLDSKLWGENKQRYTGIHMFTAAGGIVANSGVNLSELEWATLVENFHLIKEMLAGKPVNVGVFKRPHDLTENVKVYVANWYLNGKPMSLKTPPREFFSQDAALLEAREREPQKGKDYEIKDGEPEIRVDITSKSPPEDTAIMRVVLSTLVGEKILALTKKNCQGCKVDSPSQFDHMGIGDCLDPELDDTDLYFDEAFKEVQLNEMMNAFDITRRSFRLKPVLAKQLAKAALAYIPTSELKKESSFRPCPLGIVVKDVLRNKMRT